MEKQEIKQEKMSADVLIIAKSKRNRKYMK